ncbi:MAG: peptidylprolyl isomerase [Bacteroidaceae bacterium]|nr:peptidylprolyl isomerase [Bacteroidaceae bacterium]
MKFTHLLATISALCLTACGSQQQTQSGSQTVATNDTIQHEVLIETTVGNIRIALFTDTPQHRDNFLRLVREHIYDSLLFHRVIPNFMVQGGDPNSRYASPEDRLGNGDLGYTLPAEISVPKHYHIRGAVAAARQGDEVNPQRRSSASQFYIVTGRTFTSDELGSISYDVYQQTRGKAPFTEEMLQAYQTVGGAPFLDGQYTVFGEVVEGMEVVDSIQRVERRSDDRPVQDIRIIRATVTK